jgi:hypothetical protein
MWAFSARGRQLAWGFVLSNKVFASGKTCLKMENEVATPKPKKRLRKMLWILGGLIVFLIIIAAASGGEDSGNKDNNAQSQSNNSQYSYVTPENSLERQIEQAIIDKLGEKNNTNKSTVVGVEVTKYNATELKAYKFNSTDEVSGVLIKINASENLTTNLQKGTMDDEASDIYQAVFPLSPKIGDIIIWSQLPVKDQYGNTKDDTAIVFAMARPSFEKVNWSNFNHRDLPGLLDSEERLDDRNGYSELIKF